MDTTIYENNPDNGGGGNRGLFAGTNSEPSPRRAMVAFDVSSIPSNATITGVQLRLVIGQIAGSGGGAGGGGVSQPTIDLHKVLVSWGEADTGKNNNVGLGGAGQGDPAHAGDATWNARFFDDTSPVLWSLPGGKPGVDFKTAASASLVRSDTVNDVSLWLSTPALVADVQGWLASPSTNFGWMLINEDETAAQTFRAFYSRDYNPLPLPPGLDLASLLPKLIVTYQVPEPPGFVLLAMAGGALVLLRGAGGRRNQNRKIDSEE